MVGTTTSAAAPAKSCIRRSTRKSRPRQGEARQLPGRNGKGGATLTSGSLKSLRPFDFDSLALGRTLPINLRGALHPHHTAGSLGAELPKHSGARFRDCRLRRVAELRELRLERLRLFLERLPGGLCVLQEPGGGPA